MRSEDRGSTLAGRYAVAIGDLWGDSGGFAAVFTGLGAAILMGFAGLAIDVAYWEMNSRTVQGAADQAALAAAMAMSWNQGSTEAANVAKSVAAQYGFVNGKSGVSVSVDTTYPDPNGGDVKVTISKTEPQFFTRLFLKTAPTVRMSAVAKPPGAPSNGTMCVLALDESGKLDVGSVDITGTAQLDNCDLYNDSGDIESTEVKGGSVLSARQIYLAGYYTVDNNGSMTPNPPKTYVMPTPDPYAAAGISIPTYSGCNKSGNPWSPSTSTTLTASGSTAYVICGGLKINNGVTVTLAAGTYIVDGGTLTVNGGGTLTGSGVTIIVTSSTGKSYGTITFNGSSTETLTAPTTGASAGVPGIALWVDGKAPTANASLNGGANQSINGAIYLPSQQVNYAGGNSQAVGSIPATSCSQLIALTVTFSGNSYFTHKHCSSSNLPVRDPSAPPLLAQ